jgi:cell fate regulator YaaT (PSP1 superfamily)
MKVVRAQLLRKGITGIFKTPLETLKRGDFVLVENPSGPQVAQVLTPPFELPIALENIPSVLGYATRKDLRQMEFLKKRESIAYKSCRELIEKLDLPMKLVEVQFLPEEQKFVFFFTSEGRVDFRGLVKRLASKLKSKIEMRQIGVRDEAKLQGGIGPCGREICCRTFLKSFDTVTIRMAKEQNLPLNPERISGLCSRLMCCITFEMDTYVEMAEELPKIGKRVLSPYGEGKVLRQNVLLRTLTIELDNGSVVTLPMDQIKLMEETG